MIRRLHIFMILAGLSSLPCELIAQAVPMSSQSGAPAVNTLNPYSLLQKHWVVAGRVTTLGGDPVAGVKVTVQPYPEGEPRVLTTNFNGEFDTEYDLNVDLVREFSVIISTSQKGFLKTRALIDFGSAEKTWGIPITLREPTPDPELLSQAVFITALTQRLKSVGPGDGLSAKSEKDYAHGVEEFVDHDRPDRALEAFHKVLARDKACVACRTMLGLAQLQSGDWDGANRSFSQGVEDIRKATNTAAGTLVAGAEVKAGAARPDPLIAIGVMEGWRRQLERAAGFFAEALTYAPKDPLALEEMGRMELLLHNYSAAQTYLGTALSAGADPETRLLYVQALLEPGDFELANQEMNRYLNGRDVKTMPLDVRRIWARIAEKKKIESAYLKAKPREKRGLDYLHDAIPDLKDMTPAADQSQLAPVLAAVGKNVAAYFRNFPSTVSLEEIHQEKLSHKGKQGSTLDQKFHYLCLIPREDSDLGFTEYRTNISGEGGQPQGLADGFMLTSGFASASLFFHPLYQGEATFRYLGQEKIGGRDTYLIAFAQNPEKARLHGSFKMGEFSMPTFFQGLAWIDAETREIVRLREDLLRALPDVRLDKQTTDISFTETHFKSTPEGFWLPKAVEVSVDWNGKSLRNKHEYSEFRLFNVGATEKVGKPKEMGDTGQEGTQPQSPN